MAICFFSGSARHFFNCKSSMLNVHAAQTMVNGMQSSTIFCGAMAACMFICIALYWRPMVTALRFPERSFGNPFGVVAAWTLLLPLAAYECLMAYPSSTKFIVQSVLCLVFISLVVILLHSWSRRELSDLTLRQRWAWRVGMLLGTFFCIFMLISLRYTY